MSGEFKSQEVSLSDEEKQKRIQKLRQLAIELDPEVRTDDLYMTRWLLCKDWDVKGGFQKLLKQYKFQKEHPDWLKMGHVSIYEDLLKFHLGFMLDGRDKNGRRVYLMRGSHMNADALTMAQVAQIDNIWFEMVLEEMETLKNGVSVLMDMKGTSWKVLKWFTPYNSMLSSRFANLTPLKNLDFHVINTSNMLNTLISMTFPFFSKSLKEKIHFHHDNMDSLHEYIGRDVLPEEYGGPKGKKLDFEKIYRNLFNTNRYYPKEIWFLKDEFETRSCLLERDAENRDIHMNTSEVITEIE